MRLENYSSLHNIQIIISAQSVIIYYIIYAFIYMFRRKVRLAAEKRNNRSIYVLFLAFYFFNLIFLLKLCKYQNYTILQSYTYLHELLYYINGTCHHILCIF